MKGDFITKPRDWMEVKRTHQSAAEYACAIERRQSRADAGSWLVVDLAALGLLVGLVAWVLYSWGQ